MGKNKIIALGLSVMFIAGSMNVVKSNAMISNENQMKVVSSDTKSLQKHTMKATVNVTIRKVASNSSKKLGTLKKGTKITPNKLFGCSGVHKMVLCIRVIVHFLDDQFQLPSWCWRTGAVFLFNKLLGNCLNL